jgi:sigma-B regulation protein RsbU (phosphoserine phosphatase)
MRTRLLLSAAIVASWCGLLHAQNFDPSQSPQWILSLQGHWRFHPGDNPVWAQPQFDDSSWSLLRSDRDWSTQGFERYSGMGWYRFHVTLPPGSGQVSLILPHIFTSYEIYANGQLAARFGKMPPAPQAYSTHAPQLYALPASAIRSRNLQVAIRVWQWPPWSRYFGGGPSEPGAFIGDSESIERQHEMLLHELHWEDSGVFLTALLQSLGALVALSLFLLRRSEREYLWFAAILAASAAAGWIWYSYRYVVWPVWLANQLRDLLIVSGIGLAQFAFFSYLFKPRRNLVYWFVLACLLLPLATGLMDTGARIGVFPWNLGTSLLTLPLYLWIIALLAARAWQNYLDARVLFVPVLLQTLATLLQRLAIITFVLDWQHRWGFQVALIERPFPITLIQAGDLLFLAAVLAILIRRFTRTRAEEERFESEFAAARSVQQYLIPSDLPHIPRLIVRCEYRPALEVGGDFFQVVPETADGSTLVVVGDVAGKGMHAGMLAALLVGAIRTAAEFTADPARILAALNQRLQDRGIATCLVLGIAADGKVTSANAGHLPPYLNGKEIPLEGALPLGILPNPDFPVARWQLQPGDALVLLTDGVVEAQDAHGRLFGFERLQELFGSNPTAAALANAAQAFGQQDDITVLSVEPRPDPRPAALEPATALAHNAAA